MEPPVDVEESAVASCCCCCDALFGTDDQDKFAYTLNCAHSICAHCLEAADPEGRLVRWERLVRCPALGCPMQSPTLCRNTVLEELGDIAAGKREKLTVSMRGPIRECARPTHSGLLEDLFCLECSITVCAKCALLDHKTHTVVDIGDTSALQPGVLSFFQRAKHFSDAARVNEEHAAASSVLLAAARKRIEAFLDKSKSDIIERVESRFKQLFALADKELSRCDKAVKCLKDEQHIFGAQLAASAHICEAALRSNSNVELTSALRSAAMMERIVQPYAGIAATLEMDVVIDQTKLLDALACLGDLACVPVDQSASEIIKGVPVAVVEEVPPAGGAGNEGAALPAAADVAAMDAVDGTKVTLIPRDANRNTVHLQASEVSLTVCDAEGRCVGSSHVHIGQDGRVHFTVRCPAPVVEPPVLTLYVRGEALDRWISQTSFAMIDSDRTSVEGDGLTAFVVGDAGFSDGLLLSAVRAIVASLRSFLAETRVTCHLLAPPAAAVGRPRYTIVLVTARNKIAITLRDSAFTQIAAPSGAVRVMVTKRGEGVNIGISTVNIAPSGQIIVHYCITDATLTEADVCVLLRDTVLWRGGTRRLSFSWLCQSLPVAVGAAHGIVVTADGRYLVVSYPSERILRVYRVEASGALTALDTPGANTTGTLQFRQPMKMCLAASGNLFVCDELDDCVQELSAPGETPCSQVRSISVRAPCAITVHEDTLAIATRHDGIKLFSCASGAVIVPAVVEGPEAMEAPAPEAPPIHDGFHHAAAEGNAPQVVQDAPIHDGFYGAAEAAHPAQVGLVHNNGFQAAARCSSLSFLPGGQKLLTVWGNAIAQVRVDDRSCERRAEVTSMPSADFSDLLCASPDEVLVADPGNHRVCVLDASDGTILRYLGDHIAGGTLLQSPVALARVRTKVYVLDSNASRVQVFE